MFGPTSCSDSLNGSTLDKPAVAPKMYRLAVPRRRRLNGITTGSFSYVRYGHSASGQFTIIKLTKVPSCIAPNNAKIIPRKVTTRFSPFHLATKLSSSPGIASPESKQTKKRRKYPEGIKEAMKKADALVVDNPDPITATREGGPALAFAPGSAEPAR